MAALQALPLGHKYNGVDPARGRSNGAAANLSDRVADTREARDQQLALRSGCTGLSTS